MKLTAVWLAVAFLGCSAVWAAEEAEVAELRATIAKIVETEALTSRERSDWEARKAVMSELLALHRKELELLDEELASAGGSADEFADQKQEKLEEIERLKDARDAVRTAVAAARPRMLALVSRFPEPLAKEVETDRLKLEGWEVEKEPRPALQAILSMVGAAEQFNRRVTRSIEIRDGREVEVLYLGLARAYYWDHNGQAGVGTPGAEGWEWRAQPELADGVASALDQLDRKRPPELIGLPVAIESKGGGQ